MTRVVRTYEEVFFVLNELLRPLSFLRPYKYSCSFLADVLPTTFRKKSTVRTMVLLHTTALCLFPLNQAKAPPLPPLPHLRSDGTDLPVLSQHGRLRLALPRFVKMRRDENKKTSDPVLVALLSHSFRFTRDEHRVAGGSESVGASGELETEQGAGHASESCAQAALAGGRVSRRPGREGENQGVRFRAGGICGCIAGGNPGGGEKDTILFALAASTAHRG